MTPKTTNNPANTARKTPPGTRRLSIFSHSRVLPCLILAVSLTATSFLCKSSAKDGLQALKVLFDHHAASVADQINMHMKSCEQVLLGVDGVLSHDRVIDRAEFHKYVAGSRLKEICAGILSVSFVQIVPEEAKERHVEAVRKEGIPGYSIWPEGRRNEYTAVVY